MIVKILPNERHEPATKLADVELVFEEGVLSGLRLIDFAIWVGRAGHTRTVTFPARTYYVNNERRSYALLRPLADSGTEPLRQLILQAYDEFSQAQMSAHSSASQS
jgi:hypothetical protein